MDNLLRRRQNVPMRLLFAALSFAVAGPVLALTVPTDIDLRTAYCARVVATQLAGLQQMMAGEPESSPAYAFVQKTLRDQADVLSRLQSYLLPKLSGLDPEPLIAAALRADTDLEQAGQTGSVCSRKCAGHLENGRPSQRWSACVDECSAGPLTTRLRSCRTPDWLPF